MDNTFESIASGFNTEELITAIISMQFYGKNELRDSVYLASEVFASNAIRYNNVTNHVGLREHKLLAKLAKGVLNAPSINSIISQAIALRKKNATEQEK